MFSSLLQQRICNTENFGKCILKADFEYCEHESDIIYMAEISLNILEIIPPQTWSGILIFSFSLYSSDCNPEPSPKANKFSALWRVMQGSHPLFLKHRRRRVWSIQQHIGSQWQHREYSSAIWAPDLSPQAICSPGIPTRLHKPDNLFPHWLCLARLLQTHLLSSISHTNTRMWSQSPGVC